MEQYRRSNIYSHQTTGTITNAMLAYSAEPTINDGLNLYGNTRVKPRTSGPYLDTTDIEMALTSDNFDVCEFENSYIHLTVQVKLRLTNAPTITINDTDSDAIKNLKNILLDYQYVFVGLKASPHIIRNYRFKFHDIPITSTAQSNSIYEHFCYSNFKARGEIANKKWVFSPYEEVVSMDNSICGMFIPLRQLLKDDPVFDFDVIIPYTEILCLEAFTEYPNRLFGELKFVWTSTKDGFVWAQVNPIDSIRKAICEGKIKVETDSSSTDYNYLDELLALDKDTFNYLHAFQQSDMNGNAQFITGYKVSGTSGEFTYWSCNTDNTTTSVDTHGSTNTGGFSVGVYSLTTLDAWADIRGYRMNEAAVQALWDHFQAYPFSIPAQRVEIFHFPNGPTTNGLRTSMTIRLKKCTDFCLLMPVNSRQMTVYTNPALENLQLLVGSQRYPDQLISTISPEWFAQQMQNTDFDSILEATDSYERSLTDARVYGIYDEDGNITDAKPRLPLSDDTSFCPIFKCERSNIGPFMFDGMDQSEVKVELTGIPIYQTLCNIYQTGANNVFPTLCCCTNTFWIFRIVDGVPQVQYITDHDYQEAVDNPSLQSTRGLDRQGRR